MPVQESCVYNSYPPLLIIQCYMSTSRGVGAIFVNHVIICHWTSSLLQKFKSTSVNICMSLVFWSWVHRLSLGVTGWYLVWVGVVGLLGKELGGFSKKIYWTRTIQFVFILSYNVWHRTITLTTHSYITISVTPWHMNC